MSKKHYVAIARIIGEIHVKSTRACVALDFCEFLKADNPNFRKDTFLKAVRSHAIDRYGNAAGYDKP